MSATLAFPQPEPTDPDNVADALDAGLLHWVKGEIVDALRCLRQAREASDEAGNDQRALALARIAADLTPRESDAPPVALSSAAEPQPSEPRRSRLPEPPTPPKKFTGAADDATSTAASRQPAARSSVVPGSAHSTPLAVQLHAEQGKTASTTNGPLSARPSPPSTRPGATSVAPTSQAQVAARGTSPTPAGTSGNKAATTPAGASTRPDPNKSEAVKSRAEASPSSVAARPTDGVVAASAMSIETRSKSQVSASTALESRTSTRPESADHRLASVRVRIDRIEADGSIRLRQLDLAATASGEDNAMLVLPQSLWQELKRNG